MGLFFTVAGLGSLLLAYLCATGRLKRNGIVGMRTQATMASDAAWHAAHRTSAWSLAVAGLIFLALAAWIAATRPGNLDGSNVVIVSVVAVLAIVIAGGVQADRVAKGVLR